MSVTAAPGFVAAGIPCGIKVSGQPDLALVATASRQPAAVAAVFTSNLATAAPVQVSRSHLATTPGRATAVILNSGNANAATGRQGRADAEQMCALVGEHLPCDAAEVLVCSTGLIGIPMQMAPIESGAPKLVASLHGAGGPEAARAIMTTDTRPKETVQRGRGFVIGGMAKGAAMLAPNMATMLAVLTTDADVPSFLLQEYLTFAVDRSFNTLSVDGCTSTNDTVIVMANGTAGAPADPEEFRDALTRGCSDLAAQMAGDAEGATKVVRVHVQGARSSGDAAVAARRVAESQLVKCSMYGQDPYWGRVVSELGSAGVDFDPDLVSVAYGGIVVCAHGVACVHDTAALGAVMSSPLIELVADLGLGEGSATVLTNDLTHAYIDENMRTS
jgi:glutamate N-acetyltransferase / amino-acid N-acetyltransferase